MTRSGAPTSVEPPIAERDRGLVRLDTIKHKTWEYVRGQIKGWLADGNEVFVQAVLGKTAVLCADDGIRILVRRDELWVRPDSISIVRSERGEAGERGRRNASRLRKEARA